MGSRTTTFHFYFLSTLAWLLCLIAISWQCFKASAHEGHKALATKGASVDGDIISLSANAYRAVGLTTTEVDDPMVLEKTLTVTANVVVPWNQHAFVTTRLKGQLDRVLCRPGEFVEVGQKLAEIRSLELENEQLKLILFDAELDLALQTLDRIKSLGTEGIIPEKDVQAAQAIKLEKTSDLEVTKRKLIGLGIREKAIEEILRTKQPIRTLPIFSPMTGIVIHADENPGRIVEPSEHLFEIINLSTVWIKGQVVEAESYRLKKGQPVRVSIVGVPNKTFQGKVDYIATKADATTRAIPIWVVLKNDEIQESPVSQRWPIRPGMFGSIQIVTEQIKDAIACPTAALVRAGAETYVFVEQKAPGKDKPGEYIKLNVELGLRTRQWVEIKNGLFPGDKVVIDGSHELATFFVQGVLSLTLEAQRNIKLQLESVKKIPLENVVIVNATVEIPPDHKAYASSRIPGRISRILVDYGMPVKKDQVMAEVESLEFQDLQLDLMRTQTRLKLIKSFLQAARDVKNIISKRERLLRENEFKKTEVQLNGLKRKLQMIGLIADDVEAIMHKKKLFPAAPVRSPIDGYVVHFDVIPGQVVKTENPLFEIHDISKVWVQGFVYEKGVTNIRLGQTVRIRLTSDPSFLATAKLVRTNYVLSSSQRALSVWAELDNQWVKNSGPHSAGKNRLRKIADRPEPRLKHNMLARMTISISTYAPVTAVRVEAVLNEGSLSYVFVKKPDQADSFNRRKVELGRQDDRYVEIKRGLEPGEIVAIRGVQELRKAFASVR